MENTTVAGLRSRSRSKTPFLRSSCDRENCTEGGDHVHHKSGRKTPIKRNTPIRSSTGRGTPDPIIELDEELIAPPAHRTRQSAKTNPEKLIKTSDYSSEESPDRLKNKKEVIQNELNYQYERVSTSHKRYAVPSTLADNSLSPINISYASRDRTTRIGSPAYSACSTDSSFAEQALADASTLLEQDPEHREHLPYRLYKMAGEYWNKYPKTDYTYSPLSRDRVELAPGQVAVPNMSRRSLSQFRTHGPNTSVDEVDLIKKWDTGLKKRYTNVDSSDDEGYYRSNERYSQPEQSWITRLLISIITTITTITTETYRKAFGPSYRYPNTGRQERGLISKTGSVIAAPFYWIYTLISKVVTTTVTTVTETVSPSRNHVSSAYRSAQNESTKRRWWPLFLLLLPLVGYGCYIHQPTREYLYELPQKLTQKEHIVDTYKSPEIIQDPNLSKRLEALENWAVSVDGKLKSIDQKLLKIDNIEEHIEKYSLKHLHNNIVNILNINNQNGEEIASKFKEYFDKHYISKEQAQVISQEIHERLINSWKPDMDEDRIREMIQEYLGVFERRQTELLIEKVKEYVRRVEVHKVETGFDIEAVRRIVAGMLEVYDADKTGLVDYALESAGGQILSTKCTELYQIKTKQYSILGMPVWWVHTSPRYVITPGAMPAECWAFQGFPGYLVVRTYAIIEPTSFSIEHMSRLLAVDGKIESAPRNFSVYGLHDEMDTEPHLFGEYMYDENSTSIQYFPVKYPKTINLDGVQYPVAFDIFELRIESNYGNPTYTCVYRFRIHGNPLNDIKKATDDSIRESET